jgi:hypothetical protein
VINSSLINSTSNLNSNNSCSSSIIGNELILPKHHTTLKQSFMVNDQVESTEKKNIESIDHELTAGSFFGIHVDGDIIGASASLLCAIHCAVLPLLATTLPLIGLNFINEEWFEWSVFSSTILIAFLCFTSGYKEHRNILPMLIGLFGLISLITGKIILHNQISHDKVSTINISDFSHILLFSGGILIAFAHIKNISFRKKRHNKICTKCTTH